MFSFIIEKRARKTTKDTDFLTWSDVDLSDADLEEADFRAQVAEVMDDRYRYAHVSKTHV